ncbi:MAG TPA: ankyrin repeat domain-containing protein [Anaerovoracaceae bacterium]|nr:ankyrin repeat domain-containing protein [Anaerovoracaceae bacterium]
MITELKRITINILTTMLGWFDYEVYKQGQRFSGVYYSDIIDCLNHEDQMRLAGHILQKREKEYTDGDLAKYQKRLKSAIYNEDEERIEHFISLGASAADLSYDNLPGTASSNPQVVELLIKHGLDVNQTGYDLRTPLHQATKGGRLEIVKLLLANGADPTKKDNEGFTALELAEDRDKSANNYQEMVDLLRSHTERQVLETIVAHEEEVPAVPKRKNKI